MPPLPPTPAMFKSRPPTKAFRKNRRTPNGTASKAPLKGLFSDGIWKCNCAPRLPASHFQTKNGGKNHGRWFYTCQHPQPRRCGFFLWDDEAKTREAAVVLNNGRSEPMPFVEEEGGSVVTPTKANGGYNGGLLTPLTERRGGGVIVLDGDGEEMRTPYTPSKPPAVRAIQLPTPSKSNYVNSRRNPSQATTTAGSSDDEREEFFDWPASDDEAMGKAADRVAGKESLLGNNREYMPMPMPPPETPRKVHKVDAMATPGKRKWGDEMGFADGAAGVGATGGLVTPVTASRGVGGGDDVFTTPATSTTQGILLFGNPASAAADTTPTPIRYKDLPASADSELATEILESLQTSLSAPLFSEAREKVKAICNRHVMYTKGIMKGRDVSRAMVKKKEEQLVALQGELDGLRSERETDRAVIRHLRRELATRGATEGR